jgi:hypothetical protein
MRRSATSLKEYRDLSQEDFEAEISKIRYSAADSYYYDHNGTLRKSNEKMIIREDGSAVKGGRSRHFNWVQPGEHIPATLEQLRKEEINFTTRNFHVIGNGAKLIVVLDLDDFVYGKGTSEEQKMQFLYQFYYNGMGRDQGQLGRLRLICTNGSVSFTSVMSYKLHHKGNMTQRAKDAIGMYKNFNEVWVSDNERIEEMANSKGTRSLVARYIGDGETSLSTVFKGERWAKKLLESWQELGEPVNAWDLYNMQTALISHSLGSDYSTKLGYMNQLNRETQKWKQLLDLRKSSIKAVAHA